MVRSGGIEPFVDSISLGDGFYLPTSPEISLKKVFAMQQESCAGIYEIAHAFRDDLNGKSHLREFTMLEWYRKNCHYIDLIRDVVDIIGTIGDIFSPDKSAVDCREYKIISVSDLLETCLYVKPQAEWGYQEYYELARSLNFIQTKTESQLRFHGLTEIFTLLYDHCVNLFGKTYSGLFFIKDYPNFLRGMAKLSDEGWAMRVEAYLHNLELCSGYQELDNPDELLQIWEQNNDIRRSLGKEIHPVDLGLIHITKTMSGVSGMALGLERTIMALYNIEDIREFKIY